MGYQVEIQLNHNFMLCFFHLTEIQACFSGRLVQIPCEQQSGGYKTFYQVNVPLVLTN